MQNYEFISNLKCMVSQVVAGDNPQGNRIKKTRKINDLGITRVLAYVYI